jgi:hypothetical protein
MKAFQLVLALLALIPLVTGLIDIAIGARALVLFGATLSADALLEPTLGSQMRFYGAIWLGYGALILYVVQNPRQQQTLFRILAGVLVLGGVARVISYLQLGAPAPFFFGAIALELIGVPLLVVWHAALVAKRQELGPE